MKKLVAILTCIVVLFCSCDSYRAMFSIESKTKDEWHHSHDFLDGTKSHKLRLGIGTCEMKITVETNEGSLDITVTDSFGKTVFEVDDAETGDYSFTASGKIKIRVEADEHSGSFAIEKAG